MALVLLIYALALIILGFLEFRRGASFENYVLAGQKASVVLISFSMLASTMGAASTIGVIENVKTMGASAFWFIATGGIALLLQSLFLSKKVRAMGASTLAEMGTQLIGPRVGWLISLMVCITWSGIVATQFIAGAKLISNAIPFSFDQGVWLLAGIVIFYSLIGGQGSILKTDFLQLLILITAIVGSVIYLFLFSDYPSPNLFSLFSGEMADVSTKSGLLPIPHSTTISPSLKLSDLLYYFFVVGGSYFICPMMFSRLFSSNNEKTSQRASRISGIGMIFMAFPITALGLWLAFQNEAGDSLGLLLNHFLPLPLAALFLLGLLSAIFSTADTSLFVAATTIEKDLLGHKRTQSVRVIMIAVGLLAALLALKNEDIISFLLKIYAAYSAGVVPLLFVAIMAYPKKKLNQNLSFAAIACGGLGGLLASLLGVREISFLGMFLSFVLALIALFVGPQKTSPTTQKTSSESD